MPTSVADLTICCALLLQRFQLFRQENTVLQAAVTQRHNSRCLLRFAADPASTFTAHSQRALSVLNSRCLPALLQHISDTVMGRQTARAHLMDVNSMRMMSLLPNS
jgi:hypothetical protein